MISTNRWATWIGGVYEDKFEAATKKLLRLQEENDQEPIDLLVASTGGLSTATFGFWDLTRLLKVELRTIAMGEVRCAGIAIFMTGEKRIMTPHSSLHFHMGGTMDPEPSPQEVEYVERVNTMYSKIISGATEGKVDAEEVKKWMAEESIFLPEETVKMGLAHEILGESRTPQYPQGHFSNTSR